MPLAAHVQPLPDPGQKHGRPRMKLPGPLDLPRVTLLARPKVFLGPPHRSLPLRHQTLPLYDRQFKKVVGRAGLRTALSKTAEV